jgi:hypothetical protein
MSAAGCSQWVLNRFCSDSNDLSGGAKQDPSSPRYIRLFPSAIETPYSTCPNRASAAATVWGHGGVGSRVMGEGAKRRMGDTAKRRNGARPSPACGSKPARINYRGYRRRRRAEFFALPIVGAVNAHSPYRRIAHTPSMQRHTCAWRRRRFRGREFFLQLLDDSGISGSSPFLAFLCEFLFQIFAFFYVAFPELDTLGFGEM